MALHLRCLARHRLPCRLALLNRHPRGPVRATAARRSAALASPACRSRRPGPPVLVAVRRSPRPGPSRATPGPSRATPCVTKMADASPPTETRPSQRPASRPARRWRPPVALRSRPWAQVPKMGSGSCRRQAPSVAAATDGPLPQTSPAAAAAASPRPAHMSQVSAARLGQSSFGQPDIPALPSVRLFYSSTALRAA